ncbi:MAG: NAD(P)-dependent alcohol dehydrogenase [Anaerolineae bacterium]|nr:NAD(P)-dependent alcohol dehydrogenase [Anaerolineae bacterium]
MKAIVYTQYGSPDVLQLTEVEKPTPKADEVLIKVHAAAANPADWHLIRGKPFFVRFEAGFPKPKNTIPGLDIAGRVEAVGSGVTQFQPGDEVFGSLGAGGFAEYASVPENGIVLKPADCSFEEAASVPCVGFTALQGLRDYGHIQAGQKVLINGASGGVGTFAVQYARSVGAEVTGVCSTRNLDLVRSIGADHVVDYTQEDFTRTGQRYDLIFCAVGNRSASAYKRALNPNGRCVVTGFTTLAHLIVQVVLLGSWVSRTSNKKIGLMGVAQPNQQDLLVIKNLLETGKVAPVIDRRYPLSETADAIRYLEAGHARGKVIITVEPDS